ncbi:hypothetical protein BDF19DRAFT_456478 [Syncephalis fuscata]|nr:hypothetical protein BDF19DRAFT_456478 [Syncephalis fuscata]
MGELKPNGVASAVDRPKTNIFRRALSLRHRFSTHRKSKEIIHNISSPIIPATAQTPTDYIVSSGSTRSLPTDRNSRADSSKSSLFAGIRPLSGEFWPSSDSVANKTDDTAKSKKKNSVKKPNKSTSTLAPTYLHYPVPSYASTAKSTPSIPATTNTDTEITTITSLSPPPTESTVTKSVITLVNLPVTEPSVAVVNDTALSPQVPIQLPHYLLPRAASTPPEFPNRLQQYLPTHLSSNFVNADANSNSITWPHPGSSSTTINTGNTRTALTSRSSLTMNARSRRCLPPPLVPIAEQFGQSPVDSPVFLRQPYSAGIIPRDGTWPDVTFHSARTPPPTTPPPRPPRRRGHSRSKSCTSTVLHTPTPLYTATSSGGNSGHRTSVSGRSTAARNLCASPKPPLHELCSITNEQQHCNEVAGHSTATPQQITTLPRASASSSALHYADIQLDDETLALRAKRKSSSTIMDVSFFTANSTAQQPLINGDGSRRVSTISCATDVSTASTIVNHSRQEVTSSVVKAEKNVDADVDVDVDGKQQQSPHPLYVSNKSINIDSSASKDKQLLSSPSSHDHEDQPSDEVEDDDNEHESDFELPLNMARIRYDSMMPSGGEESDEDKAADPFRRNRYKSMFAAPFQRRGSRGRRTRHHSSYSADHTRHESSIGNTRNISRRSHRPSWRSPTLSRSNSSEGSGTDANTTTNLTSYRTRSHRDGSMAAMATSLQNLAEQVEAEGELSELEVAAVVCEWPTDNNNAPDNNQLSDRPIMSSSAAFLRNNNIQPKGVNDTPLIQPHYFDTLDVMNDYVTNTPSGQTSHANSFNQESIIATATNIDDIDDADNIDVKLRTDTLLTDEESDGMADPLLVKTPLRFRADSLEELVPTNNDEQSSTQVTLARSQQDPIESTNESNISKEGSHSPSFNDIESYHYRHAAARRRESIQQQQIASRSSQRTSWQPSMSINTDTTAGNITTNSVQRNGRHHRRAFSADIEADTNNWRDPCLRVSREGAASTNNSNDGGGRRRTTRPTPLTTAASTTKKTVLANVPQSPRVARLSAELHLIRRKITALYLMSDDTTTPEVTTPKVTTVATSTSNNDTNDTNSTPSNDTDTNTVTGAPGSGWVAKNVRRVMYAARDGYRDSTGSLNGDDQDSDTQILATRSSRSLSISSQPTTSIIASNTTTTIINNRSSQILEPVDSDTPSDIEDDKHNLTDDEQIAEDNHQSLMVLLSKQARAESILVRSLEVMRDDFWRPLHDYYCSRDGSFSGWLGRRASSFTVKHRSLSRNNSMTTTASSSSSSNIYESSPPIAESNDGINISTLDGPSTTATGAIRRKSHDSTLNANADAISHLSGQRMAEIIEAETTSNDTPSMVREIDGIFAFVPNLLAFHLDFSSELQALQREHGPIDKVVAVFEQRVRGLRLYADYVDRFPRALIALERLCCRDSKFAKQLRECERLAGYVNLRSILAKPRERICAYVGFLEVAADLCPPNSLAQKIADNSVDELHRLLECLTPDLDRITVLEQVATVQRRLLSLPQPLLHMDSRLLHQGELLYYPKAGQANGRMHCFLFNDRLVVTKETSEAHQYAHQTTIMLHRTVVTASEASTGRFRHVFCLRAGAWPVIFQADDWDNFRQWTEYLRLALDALPTDPMIPTRFRLVTKLQLAQMENTRSSMVYVPHII